MNASLALTHFPFRALMVQSTLAFALVGLLCVKSRPPAPVRVWLWRFAFLGTICVVPFTLVVSVPLRTATPFGRSRTIAVGTSTNTVSANTNNLTAESPRKQSEPPPPFDALSGYIIMHLAVVAWLIWAAGALRKLDRESYLPAEHVLGICAECCDQLGLRYQPKVRVISQRLPPFIVGNTYATIYLSEVVIQQLAPAELRMVVIHELAHARHRDIAWRWVTRIIQFMIFINLPGWLALVEHEAACEMAADERAIQLTGVSVSDYFQTLDRVRRLLQGSAPRFPMTIGLSLSAWLMARRVRATECFLSRPIAPGILTSLNWRTWLVALTLIPFQIVLSPPPRPVAPAQAPSLVADDPLQRCYLESDLSQVSVYSQPNYKSPVLGRVSLQPGSNVLSEELWFTGPLHLTDENWANGWFRVVLRGQNGWVWGGDVKGPDYFRGIIRKDLRSGDLIIRAGERVVVRADFGWRRWDVLRKDGTSYSLRLGAVHVFPAPDGFPGPRRPPSYEGQKKDPVTGPERKRITRR